MSTTASHSLPQILLLTHGGWGSQLCQVKALSLRWGMGGMPNDPVRLFPPRERQLGKSQKAVAVPDIPVVWRFEVIFFCVRRAGPRTTA